MNVIQTYNTLVKKIKQIIPLSHQYRIINLGWLMTGLMFSHSVHLSKIANKMPGSAKRESRTKRFSRFLDNRHLQVRPLYKPVATQLLEAAAASGIVRLFIDGTRVTSNHQLLMVALGYRGRALPIAWTWICTGKGHSGGPKQKALLSYVHQLMPSDAEVILCGDSEFTPIQAILERWGWFYALRQKGSHTFRQTKRDPWRRVDTLVNQPGQVVWLTRIELTQKFGHPCNVLALWQRGESTPWLLATNLPSKRLTRLAYKKRMWIEEMFGDFKGHGFDLEKSRLTHFKRLSRLTLAVSLLYVWLITFGSQAIKSGKRHLVDRVDRRDLSVFRIGFDLFERFLINAKGISIRDVPYFN